MLFERADAIDREVAAAVRAVDSRLF